MTVTINIWDGENYIQLNQRPQAVLYYVFLFQKNSHMWIAAIFNTTKKKSKMQHKASRASGSSNLVTFYTVYTHYYLLTFM